MLIKIPNDSFIENKNGTFLTPDELVVFAFVFRYRNLDDEVLISVNILDHHFKFKKGNDRENKNYIRSLVLSLSIDKKFIATEQEDFINKDLLYGKVRNDKTGYCGVESSIFDDLHKNNDVLELKLKFYIYSYIHCYGEKGRIVSYEKFSSLCSYFGSKKNHSPSKIKEMINEMDGKFIYRFSGDRKENSPEQEANKYFTELDDKKERDYLNHVHNKEEKKSEHNIDIPVVSGEEINWGNWKKGNLTYEDSLLYAQQEHIEEFKKVADAKIKRITNNGSNEKAVYMVDTNLEKARDDVLRQKIRDTRENNDLIMNELVGEYGVCIKLRDGSYHSHFDVPDWNQATHFVYVSLSGSLGETEITDCIEFFSSELVKHQFLSKELVNGEFRDRFAEWRKNNTASNEYETDRSIIYVKKDRQDDISHLVESEKEKPIWMTMFDDEEPIESIN